MRAQTSPHPHRRWWRCLDKDRTRPPSSRPTKTHTPSKLEKEPLNSSDISCDRNSERQPCSVSARDLSKSSRVSLSWVCCFCFLQLRENRRQVAQFASHLQFGRGQDLIVVVVVIFRFAKPMSEVCLLPLLFFVMKNEETDDIFRNLEKLCHAPWVKHFVNRISRNGDWTQRAAVCEFGAASKAELGKASYQRESIEPTRSVKNVVQAIKWLMAIDIFITSGV